jgi:hypothetical protein
MRFPRHIFFPAILMVILSTSKINQSTHGQKSENSMSEDSSIKNDLLVSMKPLENSVANGDDVNFVITITDSNSQPISDVKSTWKYDIP